MFIQLYAADAARHTSTLQSVDRYSLLKTDRMSISLTRRSTKKYCTRHVDTMSRLIARHVHRHVVGSGDAPLHLHVTGKYNRQQAGISYQTTEHVARRLVHTQQVSLVHVQAKVRNFE